MTDREPDLRGTDAEWSDTELTLRKLWEDTLQTEVTDRDVSFFAAGGDSIRSVQLVAQARRLGLPLTLRDVLAHPSIRGLAGVIDTNTTPAASGESADLLARLLQE